MTNQQAPEIYALHTVPNKGERPWSGIYAVRADAEHDAKVLRDATGRDWSVVRLVVADTATTPTGPKAETVEEAARDVGKWLNERPNRPLDLRHVAMLTHHAKRTPQPSPTAQAASSAVLKAIREANMQLVRAGDDAFMLVPYKVATAQAAESVPVLPDFDTVEQHIYGACRRYITQDMLEPIHNLIRDAIDTDRAARAPADSVTAPAGGATAEPRWKSEDFEVTHYPPMPTTGMRVGMPRGVKVMHKPTGLFAVSEDERSQHRNREVAWQKLQEMLAAAPAPTAQAAESVLEDAAASEVLMEHSGCGSGTQVDMLTVRLNPGDKVIMLKGRITQAIDAARKQGANHDNH